MLLFLLIVIPLTVILIKDIHSWWKLYLNTQISMGYHKKYCKVNLKTYTYCCVFVLFIGQIAILWKCKLEWIIGFEAKYLTPTQFKGHLKIMPEIYKVLYSNRRIDDKNWKENKGAMFPHITDWEERVTKIEGTQKDLSSHLHDHRNAYCLSKVMNGGIRECSWLTKE